MKTIDKKLSLKKKTIAILSKAQSSKIQGGGGGEGESSLSVIDKICCFSAGISQCDCKDE